MTTDEALLRDALRTAAPDDHVRPAPVERVMARGRNLRTRRRRAWTVSAAGLLVGAAVVLVGIPGSSASDPARPTRTVSSLPPVLTPPHVLQVGEGLDVGNGYTLRMGAERATIKREGGPTMVVDLRRPKTDIRAYAQERYDGESLLLGGYYFGTQPAAGARIELHGRTFDALVVTLPGSPDWSIFYVPPVPWPGGYNMADRIKVTVYAADGSVIVKTTSDAVTTPPRPGETVPAPDPADFTELGPPPLPTGVPPAGNPPADPSGGNTTTGSDSFPGSIHVDSLPGSTTTTGGSMSAPLLPPAMPSAGGEAPGDSDSS